MSAAKDQFGTAVEVGDTVAYVTSGRGSFSKGIVTKLQPKGGVNVMVRSKWGTDDDGEVVNVKRFVKVTP